MRTDGDLANSGPLPVTGPVLRPDISWPTTTGPLPAFRDSVAPAAEPETGSAEPPDRAFAADGRDAPQSFGSPSISGPFDSPNVSGPFDSPSVSGPFNSPSGSGPLGPPSVSGPLGPLNVSGPLGPSVSGPLGAPLGSSLSAPRSPSGVVVPPVADAEEQNRLPIFEAVESDWFRRVRRVVSTPGQSGEIVSTSSTTTSSSGSWASPADEGWQAAQVVHAPASAGTTSAGLPKRVPKANLVPGTAAAPAVGQAARAAASVRSAAATRDRFASYQRGVLRGRAAASGAGSDGGEDETSDEA